MTSVIAGMFSPETIANTVLNDLVVEDYPRQGELISGAEMYEAVREYFGAEEIDVHAFPLDWLLDSIHSDEQERVMVAALVNGMMYIAYRRAKDVAGDDPVVDIVYHTYAAIRIRLECRHAEIVGDPPSPYRVKIN